MTAAMSVEAIRHRLVPALSGCLAVLAFAMCATLHTPEATAKSKKLTCSFIAKQCLKECRKEVSAEFCSGYCRDQKVDCMKTGSWYGIARQFPRVIKR